MSNNWRCTYCKRDQVATEPTIHRSYHSIGSDVSKYGRADLTTLTLVCANPDCKEVTLHATLKPIASQTGTPKVYGAPIKSWPLMPDSNCNLQPDYIPEILRQDYYEACAIRLLSPKASATLTRRCLQGMIRDFCGISKDKLIDEIKELKSAVESGQGPKGVDFDTIEAIDHVRQLGNIGAHMEKDINIIVDVDPNEAQHMIELIELLFEEWYVGRQLRSEKLSRLKATADEKKSDKKPSAKKSA